MAQNTKDVAQDRRLVSDEPWELEYIHRQFPKNSHEEVVKAVEEAKQNLKGSESREKIMEYLRKKLK